MKGTMMIKEEEEESTLKSDLFIHPFPFLRCNQEIRKGKLCHVFRTENPFSGFPCQPVVAIAAAVR